MRESGLVVQWQQQKLFLINGNLKYLKQFLNWITYGELMLHDCETSKKILWFSELRYLYQVSRSVEVQKCIHTLIIDKKKVTYW